MAATSLPVFLARSRFWVTAIAAGGLAWNLFGAIQFARAITTSADDLLASGLAPGQAAVMTGYPGWMNLAFGLGVAGGIAGSLLLAARHGAASGVLAASLAAYVALWIGDLVHGVFAAMGASHVAILTLVVLIAAALYAASRLPAARG